LRLQFALEQIKDLEKDLFLLRATSTQQTLETLRSPPPNRDGFDLTAFQVFMGAMNVLAIVLAMILFTLT
jgi:hypothetical protein